jgi:hypothetical protein
MLRPMKRSMRLWKSQWRGSFRRSQLSLARVPQRLQYHKWTQHQHHNQKNSTTTTIASFALMTEMAIEGYENICVISLHTTYLLYRYYIPKRKDDKHGMMITTIVLIISPINLLANFCYKLFNIKVSTF